jgi:DNA invertase Pin-like site-specific DNA recombinase
MKPIYFAYIRKSTDTSEKQVMSLESQKIEMLRMFGDKFNLEFLEEKKSAFVPCSRPVLDDMLTRLEAGEAQGIIAWDPSRLSRNEIDAARITYLIRTGKIKDLQLCAYTFLNSPEGIMMLQFALSQSQYESSKKGKDVLREMLQKCERGWFPETAPNGYLNRRSEDNREGIIVVDELRFPLVRKAMELVMSQVLTVPAALKMLNSEWGYRTATIGKKGGKELSLSAWYHMLHNRFYCGIFTWRGKEYVGKHKPMLTVSEFDLLQRILGRRGTTRPKKLDFAFRGPLRCQTCGFGVTAETKHKFIKKRGGVASYTVYHCTHKSKDMMCPDRVNLGEEKLRSQIEGKLVPLTIRPLFLEWALDEIEMLQKSESKAKPAEDMIAKALVSSEGQLRNLVRMRARDQIDESLFLEEKLAIERTILDLRVSHNQVPDQDDIEWLEPTRNTFRFAAFAAQRLGSESLEDQRKVLMGLSMEPKLHFGKLHAEPGPWFQPIADFNLANKQEIERLEPKIISSGNQKDVEIESLRLSWLPVVKEVRTIFEVMNTREILVPDFFPTESQLVRKWLWIDD